MAGRKLVGLFTKAAPVIDWGCFSFVMSLKYFLHNESLFYFFRLKFTGYVNNNQNFVFFNNSFPETNERQPYEIEYFAYYAYRSYHE